MLKIPIYCHEVIIKNQVLGIVRTETTREEIVQLEVAGPGKGSSSSDLQSSDTKGCRALTPIDQSEPCFEGFVLSVQGDMGGRGYSDAYFSSIGEIVKKNS